MRLVDKYGEYVVHDTLELEAILSKKLPGGANSFWLSGEDKEYPALSLLVNGELATLSYLPSAGEAGFRSVAENPLIEPGMTAFSISKNRADDLFVLSDAVLSLSRAKGVAKEFFLAQILPKSIKWIEL